MTRLDLLLLRPPFVCERALLWEKPPARQQLKAMRPSQRPRLFSRLFYATDASSVLALAIRPDWATGLAPYKLPRIRLHRREQEFLVIMITVNKPQNYSQSFPKGSFGSNRCWPIVVRMNECRSS